MDYRKDKELESFRQIMEVPNTFEDGFKLSSFIGAVFLALVMIPGALYMELLAGMGIGPAAQWVTVILFIEIAKRANKQLSRAEIFILFYLAGAIVGQNVHGTPLFRQFLVTSEAAVSAGLTGYFGNHSWIAPDPNNLAAYEHRSFFTMAWMPYIALFAFRMFMSKLDHAVLSYGLFRQASDVERLPFPLAPIGAQGIMALAEDQEQKAGQRSERWRIFAIGGALGMIGGLLYLALPTLSGPLFGQTLSIFPMPFIDLNPYIEGFLPTATLGVSFDFGMIMIGMVMPFWAVFGSFIGAMILVLVNPMLYWLGAHGVTLDNRPILGYTWSEGQSLVETAFSNNVDFYFSFTIGISLVVAYVGLRSAFGKSKKSLDTDAPKDEVYKIPEGRGDIPNMWILACYFITSFIIIAVCWWLIDFHWGVLWVLLFYAFLYTPIISY
ncbi:MAG: peptide transporter, partial [Planctomycetota bacterium]